MNLARRIEKLEDAMSASEIKLPEIMLYFVKPIQDEAGLMRPGRVVSRLRVVPGYRGQEGSQEWLPGVMA